MSTPMFTETYNLVAFLEKPEESNGFEGIIDFLNASSIKYALMVNPTIYESCIKQFWATAKPKTVNGDHQIQALVDKKKVIINEKSVRSDLMLEDVEGTEYLPNDREGKGFSGRITPLFQTMMVQALEDMGEDSAAPTDSHSTPIITQPSSSKPQKKKSRRKQRKDNGPTEPIPNEATNEEHKVLDLEKAKTAQAKEIASLKKRVKQLEKRKKSRTSGLKRLRKVVMSARNDETQERNDEDLMFDTDVLNGDEVFEEPIVNAAKTTSSIPVSTADPVTTAGEVVTTASATTTVDELTLAQTLIEIKAAKPKAITIAAITITTLCQQQDQKSKKLSFQIEESKHAALTTNSFFLTSITTSTSKKKARTQKGVERPRKASKKRLNYSIQAMIKADEQLVTRLQAKEQEQFSIEEKSRMLVETE
ncbi:hypothetical protein Tco_0550883 [Tanacetum coccineum]